MADKRIFQLEEEGFLDDITDKVYMWLDKKANEGELQEPSWKFKANVFLKILNNFATKFVPNVATVEGKCYWHNGELFVCNVAYTGDWVPGNFTLTSIDALFERKDVVAALQTEISNLSNYAQNVAHNFAGEFDPNKDGGYTVGNIVIYNGVLKKFVQNHSGAWSDAHAQDADLSNYNILNATMFTGSAPFNDLDTYPDNRLCVVTSNYSGIAHKPEEQGFFVLTQSPNSNSVKFQFLISGSRKIYTRCKWSSWSNWIKIESLTNCIKNVGILNSAAVASSPYNDLDSYPINEIRYATDSEVAGAVSNRPVADQFCVMTFGGISSVKCQILFTTTGKIFIRSLWGTTWSSWKELTSSAIINRGPLSAAQASSSPYNDLNTYPINEVVLCIAPYTSVAHKPIEDEFNVLTFGGSNGAKCQILSTETKRVFARCMWANVWGSWFELREPEEFVNPLLAFDNLLCIGDSLTFSQVYTGADTSRQAKKTYPQMLATLCGNTQETMAVAGDTTADSWARYKNSLSTKTNALAIVYLGTNGGLTDTLDTDAPEADDPSTWADTNTGCYAKYVQKLQSLGYKVLLIKPWVGGGGDLATTNSVISQIGTRFGAAVLEPFHTSDTKYHYYPDLSGSNAVHYNDLGYAWFASMLLTKVAKLDNNQMKFLIPS